MKETFKVFAVGAVLWTGMLCGAEIIPDWIGYALFVVVGVLI